MVRGGAALGGLALAPTLVGSTAFAQAPTPEVGGKLSVLNWPLYLDKKSKREFPAETGIDLKYSEALNDNNEFFAKYQEQLSRNQGIGADIVVPTSWLAARMIELGYVQPLPLDQIPNAANLRADFVNPVWDPTGEYTLPWQSGITGLAYNIKETDRELTSAADLFDPKFKGKMGALTDLRATMTMVLLAEGIDPTTVTFRQAQPAFRRLEKAVDSGQLRKFTGNDYQDELVNGDFAVNVSWSGDVAQLTLENEDLRFVIPEEGGELWADVMCWVTPSKRADQVAAWMNYFYDQAHAAQVEESIQYISPVAGIEDELAALDPAAATNPLIFPPADVSARLKKFKTLDEKEEEKFDRRFAQIAGT
jgi:spermidine/putrescine transport system substrate-binding protein